MPATMERRAPILITVHRYRVNDFRFPLLVDQVRESASVRRRRGLHGQAYLNHAAACGHIDHLDELVNDWFMGFCSDADDKLIRSTIGPMGLKLLGVTDDA
jgi:hypothetical protein